MSRSRLGRSAFDRAGGTSLRAKPPAIRTACGPGLLSSGGALRATSRADMDEKTFADRADRSEAVGAVTDASSGLDSAKSRPSTLPPVTLTILVICGAIWAYLN